MNASIAYHLMSRLVINRAKATDVPELLCTYCGCTGSSIEELQATHKVDCAGRRSIELIQQHTKEKPRVKRSKK